MSELDYIAVVDKATDAIAQRIPDLPRHVARQAAAYAVATAMPLIEAETRRKVAEELKALRYCCGPDDIQCMGCDAIDDAATAIARGGNEQTREET